MNQKNRLSTEYIVDIKELIWHLAEQWKAIIVVSLCIMSCFLCGLHIHNASVIKNERQVQFKNEELSVQSIVDTLPENEQGFVLSVYQLVQKCESLSDYINTAPIMQIDPKYSKRLRFSWIVDGTTQDIDSLAMAYVMELEKENNISALLDASGAGLTEEEFNDLVFYTYPEENAADVVCCDLFLTEDMDIGALKEEFERLLDRGHQSLQQRLGAHQIINYQTSLAKVTDQRIYDKQTRVLSSFSSMREQINRLKNMFSTEQKEAFQTIQSIENGSQKKELIINTLTMRNILLGLILGGMIYICFYFFYIVFTSRAISASVLQETSIRTLGEWYHPSGTKHNIMTRDKMIWKRHHKNHLDKEIELDQIARAVENICKFNGINTLLFASIREQSDIQYSFIQELIARIGTKGIDVSCIETHRAFDVNDENLLMNSDGVVLVILESKTKYKDLLPIVDRCNEYDKLIVGSVYLG